MAELQEKRPMRRLRATTQTKPTYRIYVCHVEENATVYLLAKIVVKHRKNYTTIEIMNKEEIFAYRKLQQNFAIKITVKQFESIMALYNSTKTLSEYLSKEKLITRTTPPSLREPIK